MASDGPGPQLAVRGVAPTAVDEYDLLIITDATMSMRTYLKSLIPSLEAIIRVSVTTDCFANIGVLAYRDYDCSRPLTEWSGWYGRNGKTKHQQASHGGLLDFVSKLQVAGGHSWDEAAKTGLAKAYEVMRGGEHTKTIILFYADAPPHMKAIADGNSWETDGVKERESLQNKKRYGGQGDLFVDWVSAAKTLATGNKRAQIFPIVELTYLRYESGGIYAYLAEITGGTCVSFDNRPSAEAVSKVTVNLLLSWMGAEKQGAKLDTARLGSHFRFGDLTGIHDIVSEDDWDTARRFLPIQRNPDELRANLLVTPMSLSSLAETVPRCESPIMDLGKRYISSPEYQKLVIEQLGDIIQSDVTAMALNPVFGTLWRTVCNDRGNPARDELITKFGQSVASISDPEKKARMTGWLEESYDRVGEILEIIKSVPENERYPCVFLDPTLRFAPQDSEEESMTFTRDELLEIGRSCDYRILRRVGRVLTRLTYIASEDEVPAHVRDIPEDQISRIPLALVEYKHQRKFWKILLHAVLPGTMLAARPAALVAALTLRMGVKALEAPAYTELLSARDAWNTLEIPETWNTNCLSLLLQADKKYRLAHKDEDSEEKRFPVLNDKDRVLFQTLVDYKLLEMNLETSLTARLGWTPDKNKAPLGPIATCKSCKFPRSVTMMGSGGICGQCHPDSCDCKDQAAHEAAIAGHVSASDNPSVEITWVECAMSNCRAQYVVYFPEKLNVRAKCHYCRQKGRVSKDSPDYEKLTTAPCVECKKCKNRMIWPDEYRPRGLDEKNWECPACDVGSIKTVVEEEVTARALSRNAVSDHEEEDDSLSGNGTAWLIRNDGDMIPKNLLFAGRSVFYLISNVSGDRAEFGQRVEVLPKIEDLQLRWKGKKIHNPDELVGSLRQWIGSGKVEAGTCSLCFSTMKKRELRPACGRKGCREVVCGDCLTAWYGINGMGKVINVAALCCPFCRRQPSTRVKLPEGLRYLGGLKNAVEDTAWIYAWCTSCGLAKQHLERVCAAGAPAEVANFKCEDCSNRKTEFVVKDCPGCGVTTEKQSGCDHISCICGMHWCWYCGEESSEYEIYEHMSREHGGWYEGRRYDGEYESDDDEDY
ncbi:E3 ubiquitin-protein ligase itt1 [Cladorrhinum sp. PSN259]|nr:E3 ubiquitin-protein ligase itt1 [Cladorrhinum sp. PSN259]